jgi:hypothetical protein
MDIIDVLQILLEVIRGNGGTPPTQRDADNINEFETRLQSDPAGISFDLLGAVSGIPIGQFYANSASGFNMVEAGLWNDLLAAVGNPANVVKPNWDPNSTLGQIAEYLDRYV